MTASRYAGKRAAILYNPVARTLAHQPGFIPNVAAMLAKQRLEVRLVPTEYPGSATEQVKSQIAEGCELILAAGGDGTINEVADGMLYTGVPLGIIPGGTANVLARELKLPSNPIRAAELLGTYEGQKITTGSLRGPRSGSRSFVCMAGIGLDADIISKLNLDFKAAAGKLAYYVCGFSQVWRKLPEFNVDVDGKRYRASFALISRVRNYGGDLEIARGASLLRNDFEVVLFQGTKAMQYLSYFVGVALKRVEKMQGCEIVRGRTVSCSGPTGEPVYVQVDGELIGEIPLTAETMPGALTLLVPPEFARRERAVRATVAELVS